MNTPLESSTNTGCGACAGTEASTPPVMGNRPGLGAIAFRSGTHSQFKASLLAALTVTGRPGLRALRTRADDDFTIALLDGFAAMADVLTFYSERIANESFLRTATERRSVLELARAIGYELKPGVAANAWLAFTVEDAPGAPGYATVGVGNKVQSVPGPNEKPQVYETVEPLEARKEWNELRVRTTEFQTPVTGMNRLHLQGTTTNLKPGDVLLVIGEEWSSGAGTHRRDVRKVLAVEPRPAADATKSYTVVTLDRPLGSVSPPVDPAQWDAKVFALRTRANLLGYNAPDWRAMPTDIKIAFTPPNATETSPPLREWPGFTLGEISAKSATGVGSGLFGEYYNTADFRERRLARIDGTVDFNWGTDSPDPRLEADTFSIRWTGWVQPRVTGSHIFSTLSDDGVRLWVNGELIIDNWTDHGPTTNLSRAVSLEEGKKYPIRLEYYENGGGTVIKLMWSHGDTPKVADAAAKLTDVTPKSSDVAVKLTDVAPKTTDAALKITDVTPGLTGAALKLADTPTALTGPAPGAAVHSLSAAAPKLSPGSATLSDVAAFKLNDVAKLTEAGPKLTDVTKSAEAAPKLTDVVKLTEAGPTLSGAAGPTGPEVIPTSQLFPPDGHYLHLDAIYKDLLPGGWAVLSTPDDEEVFQIVAAIEDGRTGFTLSAKCTRLTLLGENLLTFFNDRLRDASVFTQSEWLPWAETPIRRPVLGAVLELGGALPEPPSPRRLLIQGRHPRARVALGRGLILKSPGRPDITLARGREVVVVAGPSDWTKLADIQDWNLRLADGGEGLAAATLGSFEFLPAAADDPVLVEQATLKQALTPAGGGTTLRLSAALRHAYDPATVKIFANVALATHGESTSEILGNGDSARAHQQFVLKQSPLTFIAAPTASGSESTLALWINDVKWMEVASLYARDKRERVFVSRRRDDGATVVTFGDGRFGARLPTGHENIRAVFRKGIGLEGQVRAGQLSLLMTRPLGLKAVINPTAASGAENPEVLEDARRNAPMQVLTLGRVVSLQDYEDFARSFGGIAKARASWVWTQQGRGVFVSVVAPEGGELSEDATTIGDLRKALRDLGNPLIPVRVRAGVINRFSVAGTALIAADRIPERVKSAVDAALTGRFDFAAADFGRNVALSEVFATIQGVPGVIGVQLNSFRFLPPRSAPKDPLNPLLTARQPAAGADVNSAEPAELLVLDGASLSDLVTKIL